MLGCFKKKNHDQGRASCLLSPSSIEEKKGPALSFDAPPRSAGADVGERNARVAALSAVSCSPVEKRRSGDECASCCEVNGGIKVW